MVHNPYKRSWIKRLLWSYPDFGAGGVRTVLNPKGLDGEFIDGWEAYRREYWANETERHNRRVRAGSQSRGNWWWLSWRRRIAVTARPVSRPDTSSEKKTEKGTQVRDGPANGSGGTARSDTRRVKPAPERARTSKERSK
jgi:hypothetical protein